MTRIDPHEYTIRKRPIRVTVAGTASRPPGRGKTWTVEAGHDGYFRAEGLTEVAAAQDLADRLQAMLAGYRPPLVLTFRGHTAVLSLDLPGEEGVAVETTIACPDGRIHMSQSRVDNWDQAVDATRSSLAHLSTDWHDDGSVHAGAAFLAKNKTRGARDLFEYAAWQRAAKAAMDAGEDDWHRWATDHASEFAVPATGTDVAPAPPLTSQHAMIRA
jgi:hypothetical protein